MAECVCCFVVTSVSLMVSAFLHLARRFWNQICSTNKTNQMKTLGCIYYINEYECVCVCVANRDCFVITALPGFVISYTRFIGLKIHSFLSHRDTDTALESRHLGPEARIWSKVERLVPEFWTEIWLFPCKSTGFDSDQRSPFRMKYMPTVLAFQGQFKRKLTLTYT